MRTNMTMKATMGLIGGIVLVAAGCTVTTSTGKHSLPVDTLPTIPAGTCVFVGGPSGIPGGAETSYSISDDIDDMDIAVIDDAYACDPIPGDIAYTTGVGSVSNNGTIPATSTYNLAIACFNDPAVGACIPTVNYWDYD
jgi:hypothetical protein